MWVSTVITACDKKHSRHGIYYSQKKRVFDGLKLGSGFLLIVVNCCAACRAAMCVGYMKCLLYKRLMFTFSWDYYAKRAEIPCLIYAQPD